MKLRIKKDRKAKRDALRIYVYIGEDNLAAADRFLQALNSDIKKLAEMPGMGAMRSFSRDELTDVRSWPITGFPNYLIFYRATADAIQIMRIIHGARDIEAAWNE